MKKVVKVPVIMQMEMLECGAASLAMILAYYGKWVPLEKVRNDCGVSRDGSTAKNIVQAARLYELKSKGYRSDLESIMKEEFPLIIHWNFNHFVVLDGFKKGKAILNDPAQGRIEVPMSEFDKSFTGVFLKFEPSDTFVADGQPQSILKFAKKRLKGTESGFAFIIITSLLAAIIGIISPVLSKIFLDNILPNKNIDWFVPFISIMVVILILQTIVAIINAIYMLKVRGKLAIVSNSIFMWHVLRLPIEFFSQRFAGDIVKRQESNESIAETLISSLAPVALNLCMISFYILIMSKYSQILTLIGIVTALINVFVAQYISKKRINITRVQMRDSGKLASTTMSGIEMIETIKSSGAENGFFEKWTGYHASVNSSKVKYTNLNVYLGAIPSALIQITNIVILALGAYLIMIGEFSTGMLLAFQGFMTQFMNPVSSLIQATQSMQEMRTSIERVEDVMNYKADVDYTDNNENDTEYSKLTGTLELKNVTFGYNKMYPPLIENFNLKLSPGSKVAFVGTSGCGKSTLSKLISGLYKPWTGEVLFDGKPQSDIPREIFTGSLAVVDQDITLFADTISNNIKMWDTSIEDFEVIMAAHDAQIHEDILQRDKGYNTMINEGGKNFSGGQCQRLEIARVLAQDPTIIILDEATSALDAKTEFEVTNAIKNRGITCIIVAHRLSTIRDCDEIIVMDKGKVVERGTHEELLAAGGKYTQLITTE